VFEVFARDDAVGAEPEAALLACAAIVAQHAASSSVWPSMKNSASPVELILVPRQRLRQRGFERTASRRAPVEQWKDQGDLHAGAAVGHGSAIMAWFRRRSGTIAFFPTKTAPCAFRSSMFRR
jgi:hypothetical protein